ncbi:MAG: hypothetical protein ICV85_12780 [Tolypothrix sp. T3-bin4]|nr:hypothetical protein [Tolypothrix sp. Co-bin9]MBD0303007.1 hypothetical protein [Tolypothrix sp. T3-bin4]
MPDQILTFIQEAIITTRDQIVEAIGDQIGIYTFPDPESTTDRAISILGLGSANEVYPPKDTRVTGLEVVLVTLNGLRLEKRLDGLIQTVTTRLILKQFDPTKNTIDPLLKLIKVLDFASDPVRTVPDPMIGNIEVCETQLVHSFYHTDEDF